MRRRVWLDRVPLVQNYFHPRNIAARRAYTGGWTRFASRAAGGAGALAAAGLANFFSKVPSFQASDLRQSKSMPRAYPRAGGRSAARRSRNNENMLRASGSNSMGNAGLKDDKSPYTQYALVRRTSGRKLSQPAKLQKLVSALTQPIITRWQNVAKGTTGMDATSGAFPLNYQSAAASPGTNVYPYYLFDLTGMPNATVAPSSTATAYLYPNVGYRLNRTRTDAGATELNNQFKYAVTGCVMGKEDGTLGSYFSWLYERKPRQIWPMGSAMLDWVDVRLQVYGATNKPTRVNVKLVRFTDEDVVPQAYTMTDAFGTGIASSDDDPSVSASVNDTLKKWNEWHMGQVDTLISCPIQKRDHLNLGRKMQILYTESIDINPTSNTESDTRGHIKAIKLFKRLNRVTRFDHQAQTTAVNNPGSGIAGVGPSKEMDPNIFDYARGDNLDENRDMKCYAKKMSRIFLLISAQSPVDGVFAAASHASFDLIIRRRHSVIGST